MVQWLRYGVVLALLALAIGATGGCASGGGSAKPEQDKDWDRPPGWVPFSA